jgi:hypothetical protein
MHATDTRTFKANGETWAVTRVTGATSGRMKASSLSRSAGVIQER